MEKFKKKYTQFDTFVKKSMPLYLVNNSQRIYISLFIIIGGFVIVRIPYLVLIFKPELLYPITIALAFFILRVNERIMLYTIILIFGFAPILVIFNNSNSADRIINIAFFLILLLSIKLINNLRQKKYEKRKS